MLHLFYKNSVNLSKENGVKEMFYSPAASRQAGSLSTVIFRPDFSFASRAVGKIIKNYAIFNLFLQVQQFDCIF